jgi:hypothetical protein
MPHKTNKNTWFPITIIFVLAFSFTSLKTTLAAPDSELTYHGKLTDTSNVAVTDGNYDFTVVIYDAPTGGNCLWSARGNCTTPTAKSLTLTNGIFSTTLGESGDNPLTLDFSENYYLGIKIGTNTEMTPRRKITPTGFALNANRLNGLTANNYINTSGDSQTKTGALSIDGNFAVNTDDLFVNTSTGRVGIGTNNPGSSLHLSGPLANDAAVRLTSTATGGNTWVMFSGTNTNNSVQDGSLGFWDSGSMSTRMLINPSGNVGIGTSTPNHRLHLYGTSSGGADIYSQTTSAFPIKHWFANAVYNWSTGQIGTSQAPNYQFRITDETAGLTRLGIDTLGRVGIGTTLADAQLHTVATTEQMRLGYNATNYLSTTVNATGTVTFNAVGTGQGFTFNDPMLISGNLTTAGHILPNTDNAYDLGSNTNRFRDLYLGPSSLHIGTNGNEGIISYDTTNNVFNFNKAAVFGTTVNNITGAIRWSGTDFEGYDGLNWLSLTSGGTTSPLTTKGDLYTFSTTEARLPVGTNGQVLMADSTEATGLKWADASSGGVVPSFLVHKNGVNQSIPNETSTVVTWSTEAFDTNNDFASNRFTVTVPGKYLFTGSVGVETITDTSRVGATLRKNGSVIAEGNRTRTGDHIFATSIFSIVVDAQAGDYFDVIAIQDTGSAQNIYGQKSFTYFSGSRIDGGNGLWTLNSPDISYTSGNVGIGTTDPTQKLTVGSGNILMDNTYGIVLKNATGTFSGASLTKTSDDNLQLKNSDATGSVQIMNSNNTGGIDFYTGSGVNKAMTINNTGGVEIGQNSVNGYLKVVSDRINASGSGISSPHTQIVTTNGVYNTNGIVITAGTNISSGITNSGYLQGMYSQAFHTSAGNLSTLRGMLIQYGNYTGGTGTVSQATGLYLSSYRSAGTITTGYGIFMDDVEATNGYGIYQAGTNDTNAFLGYTGFGMGSPNYRVTLPNTASVAGRGIANQWAIYSDARVKTNQNELSYGLNELLQLTPKSYIHNSSEFIDGELVLSGGEHTLGLIAQEVYGIIPEAVGVPEDENSNLWSLDYDRLVPITIKAIQQQNTLITENSNNLTTKAAATTVSQLQAQVNDKFTTTSELITANQKDILTLQEESNIQANTITTITKNITDIETDITTVISTLNTLLDGDLTQLTDLLAIDAEKLVYTNADGDITLSGITTVDILKAQAIQTNKITINDTLTQEDENGDDVNAASIGTETIVAGETAVDVESRAITENSRVFVTARNESAVSTNLTVVEITDGSCSVALPDALEEDLTFDWFVVQGE